MSIKTEPTQTVERTELRQHIDALVTETADDSRVLIQDRGQTVATIVSTVGLHRLRRLDEREREIRRVLNAMSAPFEAVPSEEIEREATKALAEVRGVPRGDENR